MPTKYSPEKISDPRIPATKILDPQSTHEKKIRIHNVPNRKTFGPISTHKKKFQTHKIPTRKNSEPRTGRWQDGTGPIRLTMARYPRNLAHSPCIYSLIRKRCLLTYAPKSQQSLLT